MLRLDPELLREPDGIERRMTDPQRELEGVRIRTQELLRFHQVSFDSRKITYGFPGRRRLNPRRPSRTSSLRAATPPHGSAYAARLQRMLQAAGKEPPMIVRIWHGRTWRTRADEYAVFLTKRAIPDYRGVAGNLDVSILRRDDGDVSHFLTVTRWES